MVQARTPDGAPAQRDRLDVIARDALRQHGFAPDAPLTLLSISENATYAVDDPGTGERSVLRVHRAGYHSRAAIESELAWVGALRADGVVATPAVLPAPGGALVVTGRHPDGERRHAVRFAWCAGAEPAGERLVDHFRELGAVAARLHRHARTWRRPEWFTRFRWDHATSLGPRGHWGRWQDGIAVGPAERQVLGRLDAVLERRLAEFGAGPDRFGLVHADMRLANLLVDTDISTNTRTDQCSDTRTDPCSATRADISPNTRTDISPDLRTDAPAPDGFAGNRAAVTVIDFDDSGFGWFLYDLGASLSFIEHDPRVPELVDAWAAGYRTVAPLGAAEEAELTTFVMLRRMLLVAWIGSHADTDLAQAMGAQFTATSCDLAEAYLSRPQAQSRPQTLPDSG